jgi:eukaryotic-like serine/threonine-protein kinase
MNPGEIVGDYRVIALIGAGGMGAVYKVEHLITRRIEAMKVLSTGLGCESAWIRGFEREIQVQARLQHPNIAALYSAVRHGDALALVMEYVEGESLQQVLARGRLSLLAAIETAGQLLEALDYAHRNGVIHGDVSPANILLASTGAVKLTDFGLACEGISGDGVPAGTAWYMSPEQVIGVGKLEPTSDIYGAGVVLYAMLTGRKLFDAEGSFAIMRAHAEIVPEPPSASNPSVPPALDAVVARALAKDAAARFQTAADFRAAIVAAAANVRPSPVTKRRSPIPRPLRGVPALTSLVVLTAAGAAGLAVARFRIPEPPVAQLPAPPPPAVREIPIVVVEPPPEQPASPPRILKPVRAAVVKKFPAVPLRRPAHTELAPAPIPTPGEANLSLLPEIGPPVPLAAPSLPAVAVEVPKPAKSGNRFVKALGKLNPFRRAAKDDPADQTKASVAK